MRLEVMPHAILPRTNFDNDDDKKNNMQVQSEQKNQVECISISSIQETNDDENEDEQRYSDDFEYENSIAVNDEPHLPHFGSVNVVNSNDVHFGNRTVYKGPVTIKQFVYPKGDTLSDISGLNNCIKTIYKSNNGIDNNDFVKEQDVTTKSTTTTTTTEERAQETNNDRTTINRIRKGGKWIKAFPFKDPKQTMLFMVLLLVSITTISAVLIWRYPIKSIPLEPIDGNVITEEEEDRDRPVDYQSDGYAALSKKARIVSRLNWLAQPPTSPMDKLNVPVSLVIIQHTATDSCRSQAACVLQTRTIQTFHIESRSWSDIAYNFIIGGDGAVYEGRGWTTVGAHTFSYNNISIGVAFIGTFNTEPPDEKMINAFNNLVATGVKLKYLTPDYEILAARQLSGTESPGKAFYDIIKTWSHWTNKLS